jgi:hypothetical protein
MRIPSIVTRQRFGKYFHAATNTHTTIKELFDAFVFYAVRVISGKL